MAVPRTPVLLPGGEALVRDGNFILDADGCCCDSTFPPTTTSTTTEAPITTTTGEPATQCPDADDDDWCIDNCPSPLFAVVATGDCSGIPGMQSCGALYAMTDGTSCQWTDAFLDAPSAWCFALLSCQSAPFRWQLTVYRCSNLSICTTNFVGFCNWTRPLFVDDCPMGAYTFSSAFTCDACSPTVGVFS